MANTNFTVHNGLTVGPASIDAASGNITTTGSVFLGSALNYTPQYAKFQHGDNINNYVQLVVQNQNNGNQATTDFVAVANNGSDNDTFIDFGINSSGYNQAAYNLTGPNDGYLYVAGNTSTGGGNLVISTYTLKDIVFSLAGSASGNEIARMRANTNSFVVSSTTNSTSSTTGSIITAGGIGVSGSVYANLYVGSAVYAGTIGNSGATLTGTLSTAAQTNITSVGTLSSLSTSGVITSGGNINITTSTNSTSSTTGSIVTAGGIGVAQDAYIGGKLYVGGNTTFINTTIINTTDTLSAPTIQAGTIGNTGATFTGATATFNGGLSSVATNFVTNPASQDAGRIFAIYNTNYLPGASYSISDNRIFDIGVQTGNIAYIRTGGTNGLQLNAGGNGFSFNNSILPSSNASINIGGTGTNYWNNVYAVNFLGTSTTAKYADLAERYSSDANYEPGTVVDFGGDREITLSNINGSQYVAGVVSTNPAYMMNSDADGLYIALVGRVPTKVTGRVRKGQMMVSNGDGTARSENNPIMGSVIGKALENFAGGTGVIEVVVGRL